MFYRNIVEDFREWAERDDRKPLIIRGVRQIGKTTAVKLFSRDFDYFIHLNLDDFNERKIFEREASFNDILENLFYYAKVPFNKGKTLIFIDEIQESPKAVSLMRYFYENAPELYVIAAGSLLENAFSRHISFPVGRVEFMKMHPLSFGEFLLAIGEEESFNYYKSVEIPDFAHESLVRLFKRFATIGGMPEVIKTYAKYRDLIRLKRIYSSLITTYLDDVEKYASSGSVQYVNHVISHAFSEAGNRITFENFGNSPYRSREISEAFDALDKTMMFKLIYPITSTVLPLIPDYKKKPRLHVFDTGLVNYSLNVFSEFISKDFLTDVYRGRIAEHIVGQEIEGASFEVDRSLNFWVRNKKGSDAEVDYVVAFGDRLIPVEVKSGAKGRLRSLMKFVDESPHPWAVRFYEGRFLIEDAVTLDGKKFKLINLPIYLSGRLEQVLARIID